MTATPALETFADDDFARQEAELLKRAKEKPTLQMINSGQSLVIAKWQERYPGLALFIEVTKEDFSKIYEGKLIATAENSIEFLDLRKDFRSRNIVSFTVYGDPIDERPISLPPIFWFGVPLVE